mgnify:CR=1 FL=1
MQNLLVRTVINYYDAAELPLVLHALMTLSLAVA